jgi:hypothetical protein
LPSELCCLWFVHMSGIAPRASYSWPGLERREKERIGEEAVVACVVLCLCQSEDLAILTTCWYEVICGGRRPSALTSPQQASGSGIISFSRRGWSVIVCDGLKGRCEASRRCLSSFCRAACLHSPYSINFLTEAIQSPNVSCCWNGPTAVHVGCWVLIADC